MAKYKIIHDNLDEQHDIRHVMYRGVNNDATEVIKLTVVTTVFKNGNSMSIFEVGNKKSSIATSDFNEAVEMYNRL